MARLWIAVSILTNVLAIVVSSEPYIDPLDCPLQCVCTGYVVDCFDAEVFPENLPEATQEFSLSASEINSIPSNVFLNLENLNSINITNVKINTVMACAFAELEGVSIYFESVDIEVMEGNSFSNIAHARDIFIYDSNIQEMKSFAFHNIQNIQIFEIVNSNIGTIHPYAFRHVANVSDFSLRNSTVDRFLKEGFSRFFDVDYMYILRSTIISWQCGSVQTFSKSDEGFYVSASTLMCDCSLAWLWRLHPNSSIIHTGSNRCYGSGFMLSDLDMNAICEKEAKQMSGCPQLLPTTPHTCSRKFDTPFVAENKVEYPKFFSKKPDDTNFTTKLSASYLSYLLTMIVAGLFSVAMNS